MKNKQFQFLLTLYNSTQSEITRYRNREWATLGIFVAALATIVGFIITNYCEAKALWWAFDLVLVSLAVGNVYYTIFTHNELTEQRNVLYRLNKLLSLDKIQVDNKNLVFYKLEAPIDDNFCRGWFNGFWSHIFPFSIFGIGLCVFGIWLLHRC